MNNMCQILYAEDDIDFGEIVKKRLESESFRVKLCPDGKEAWREIRENPYDIILLDYDMPGIDGIELTKMIRQRSMVLPIVIYSSYTEPDTTIEAYQAGVNNFFTKNYDPNILILSIKTILSGRNSNAESSMIGLSEDLVFYPEQNMLVCHGKEYPLGKELSRLLILLYTHVNHWTSGDFITGMLWNLPLKDKDVALRQNILRLREKISVDPSIQIENRPGGFYRLNLP
ncbi:MAG: response regulator transcription factor [Bacteroidales bacterium]|nr:response regulator transcription factor [Bacteroidales bacterium]